MTWLYPQPFASAPLQSEIGQWSRLKARVICDSSEPALPNRLAVDIPGSLLPGTTEWTDTDDSTTPIANVETWREVNIDGKISSHVPVADHDRVYNRGLQSLLHAGDRFAYAQTDSQVPKLLDEKSFPLLLAETLLESV